MNVMLKPGLFSLEQFYFIYKENTGGRSKGEETKLNFQDWIEARQSHPLIQEFINTRDTFIHAYPMRLSQEDFLYFEGTASPEVMKAHEMLHNQLEEIEAIIEECEKRFK